MPGHRVYAAIVEAVKNGTLKESFGENDFRGACPGFAEVTYKVFLNKHRKGNPGGNSELFEKLGPRSFKLIRPYKYGF